jgi:Tetratricopeptide repeat
VLDGSEACSTFGDVAEALRLNGQMLQYYAAKQYQRALPIAQRALAITEKARGPEHPDTAVSRNDLAELYRSGRLNTIATSMIGRWAAT